MARSVKSKNAPLNFAQVLPANSRLSRNVCQMTNALAYLSRVSVMKKKKFYDIIGTPSTLQNQQEGKEESSDKTRCNCKTNGKERKSN